MKPRQIIALAATGILVSCSGASDEAHDVADMFWEASRVGDTELVRSLVASGSQAKVNEPENRDAPFGDYALGDVSIEDGVAAVETTVEGIEGSTTREVEFNTFLIQEDGTWKVDLDRTTNDMMRVMLGVTMEQLGEMMGEAMGKAMEGMVEGMAEGMKEGMEAMGEAMNQAADTVRKENRER